MGKLTEEDRAEILVDAAIHGDSEAASMHGTHPRHIAAMRDAMAGGPNVSGAGKVSLEALAKALMDRRIREVSSLAHLKAAQALGRLLDKDAEDSQATMAATKALETMVNISGAYEVIDAMAAEREEQRKKLNARETTGDDVEEPRRLEAHDGDEETTT